MPQEFNTEEFEDDERQRSVLPDDIARPASLTAQSRPDFSGNWKQDMEKSPTKSSWLKGYVNKIELQYPTLKVTTTTVGDRGERTMIAPA